MPRIPIEQKHTYVSVDTSIMGSRTANSNYGANNTENRYIINYQSPNYPVTGTDENNRIGRKITSQSIVSEFYLSLLNTLDNDNLNTVYDFYTVLNSNTYTKISQTVTPQTTAFNTNEQNLDVSIRHMFVEFDPEQFKNMTAAQISYFLWDWFVNLNINSGGTDTMHSNRQQVKRESTAYTGQFNIIHDKVIHLSLQHPIYHGNVTIPYKRHLSFDSQGANPTNKLLFELFIGPTNCNIDYGSYSYGQVIQDPAIQRTNIYVAELKRTMKFTFVDI